MKHTNTTHIINVDLAQLTDSEKLTFTNLWHKTKIDVTNKPQAQVDTPYQAAIAARLDECQRELDWLRSCSQTHSNQVVKKDMSIQHLQKQLADMEASRYKCFSVATYLADALNLSAHFITKHSALVDYKKLKESLQAGDEELEAGHVG